LKELSYSAYCISVIKSRWSHQSFEPYGSEPNANCKSIFVQPAFIRDALHALRNRPDMPNPKTSDVKKAGKNQNKDGRAFFFGSPLIYAALSFTHLAIASYARISLCLVRSYRKWAT